MNIKDVITLTNAGFSKDEILKLFTEETPAEQTPEVAPEQPPAQPPAQPPESVEELSAYAVRISELENENAELRKLNQTLAILHDSAPQPLNADTLGDKAIDSLASVIKPLINEQKGAN